MGNPVGSRRRIYASGAYGFANFGDDLFEETVRQRSDQIWPNAVLRTFVPARYSGRYANAGTSGKVSRIANSLIAGAWADTFAICGGSVLQDVSGVSRLRYSLARTKSFEALGVSVGPFEDWRAKARVMSVVAEMDRIIVRDKASGIRLAEEGVTSGDWTVGGDLAALSPLIDPPAKSTKSDHIVICASAASGISGEQFAWQTGKALSAARAAGASVTRVVVLALSSNPNSDDRPLSDQIARELLDWDVSAQRVNYADIGLKQTIALVGDSLAVWSQRLHGAIVGYLMGRPFVLIGHHAKCVDFGADIGADRFVVESGSDWADVGAESVIEGVDAAVSPEEYRQRAREVYLLR